MSDYQVPARSPRSARAFLLIVGALLLAFVIFAFGGQLVWLWLNIKEFGELFLRPFYFELAGGLILASIALIRLDFLSRRSLVGWMIRSVLKLARDGGRLEDLSPSDFSFETFRLPISTFAAWQLTKVLVVSFAFSHIQFGMTLFALLQNYQLRLSTILAIFRLPFETPPFSTSYVQNTVIPAIPALTLLVAPLLGAIGIRLILLTGITHLIRVFSSLDLEKWRTGERLCVLEALAAIGAFWSMFNAFFANFIDFNTKLVILGLGASGLLLTALAIIDLKRRGKLAFLARRTVYIR